MAMNDNELTETIIAAACGTAPRNSLADLDRRVAADPDAARWREELQTLVADMRYLEEDVPTELDEVVLHLIRHGIREDPWFVIGELADEVVDLSLVRQTGQSTVAPEESQTHAAAELSGSPHRRSQEEIIRDSFHRVEECAGHAGDRAILAAPLPDTWVGVVVSASSVPISGVEIRWVSADKRARQAVSDRRGAFILETGRQGLISVSIGPPVAVERSLQ